MDPAFACCPGYNLIPNLRPIESRLLVVCYEVVVAVGEEEEEEEEEKEGRQTSDW